MTRHVFALFILSGLLALTGCQTLPPSTEAGAPANEAEEADDNLTPFNPDEIVIGAEDDSNTFSYIRPKRYESPLTIKNDLWDRVRKGFQLNFNYQNKRIDAQVNLYTDSQDYLDRVNMRASRYLWYITEEIERRHMPSEIALLPIVESAYDPFAYSHGRASGMWQFISDTARLMGLKQDWWYDGRRDVIQSTNAALDLLQRLHDDLNNDWLLALAAYNSGEGNVLKAIRKNKKRHKPTDFWNLDLPKETRAYAPKLLALARIYNDPKKYNIYLMPIHNEPYFDIVETGSQIDLARAAQLANIELDELYLLNPAFNRWATNPAGPHQLLVPKENAGAFRAALADFPTDKRIIWERYTVKHGDSIGAIAYHFNTTQQQLISVNKLKQNPSVKPGDILMIPVASSNSYALSKDERIARIQNTPPPGENQKKILYTVEEGDTFWSVGEQYKVEMHNLAKWNGLAVRDTLHAGQQLVIWVPESQTDSDTTEGETSDEETTDTTDDTADTNDTAAEGSEETEAASQDEILNAQLPDQLDAHPENKIRKITYHARRGDSIAKVAKRFDVTQAEVIRWNNLKKDQRIKRGKSLVIYVDITDTK